MINQLLKKRFQDLTAEDEKKITEELVQRLLIEHKKQDRSGIYGETQYEMAYHSNRIEGSTLTEKQTLSLFETGTLPASDEVYRAKDIEEATGHFLMFNEMLHTFQEELSHELIKRYHYRLKSGVFEDQANGYPIGEYKNRRNRVSDIQVALPQEVPEKMEELFDWYKSQKQPDLSTIAVFHARYENIHPFQDGNGRTGRMLLFKECLKNGIIPAIIRDEHKMEYYHALHAAQLEGAFKSLELFLRKESELYYKQLQEYLFVYEPEHKNAWKAPQFRV